MNLTLSDEQEQLQKLMREYCRDRSVASQASFGQPTTEADWRQLAALGVLDLASDAGAGCGVVEQVIVAEELSTVLLCAQYAPTVAYVVPLLRGSGDLCIAVTDGRDRFSFGSAGQHVSWDGELLSGEWQLVRAFESTDRFLLADEVDASARIWVVEPKEPGVETEVLLDFDLGGTTRNLKLERVAAQLFATVPVERLRDLETHARILLAAELAGVAEAAISQATAYANVRTTFGRPIGSYQAISHPLADSVARLEGLRSLLYWAACHFDSSTSEAYRLSLAVKALAGDIAIEATARALHTFGGIGFTWEHPIHRFYRRAIASNAAAGSSFELHHRLGIELVSAAAE